MAPKDFIKEIELIPMEKRHIEAVVSLISLSMNEKEGQWAQKTMEFHFFLQTQNVDDGRKYLVALFKGRVIGITGLHNYEWGPRDITWLGWFAVAQEFHGQGLGAHLMQETLRQARHWGYRKLFVETYSSEDFARARAFYQKFGFQPGGQIHGYLDSKTDMMVYAIDL